MTDMQREILTEFGGLVVLVAEVDGVRVMAPVGSPPPEDAQPGLWLRYDESMAALRQWVPRAVAAVDPYRCICDPADVFDPAAGPTPFAVEGCTAHKGRRAYQQWAISEGLVDGRSDGAGTAG